MCGQDFFKSRSNYHIIFIGDEVIAMSCLQSSAAF